MSTVGETLNNQEGRTTNPVGINQLSPQTLVARMGARKSPNSRGSVLPWLLSLWPPWNAQSANSKSPWALIVKPSWQKTSLVPFCPRENSDLSFLLPVLPCWGFLLPPLSAPTSTTTWRPTECLIYLHSFPHVSDSQQGSHCVAKEVWPWETAMGSPGVITCQLLEAGAQHKGEVSC